MSNSTSYTLKQIADLIGAKLSGDPDHTITGVENLESAENTEVSFLANTHYLKQLRKSNAGAVIIPQSLDLQIKHHSLIHPDPSKAFQQLIELFHQNNFSQSGFEGIHPTATIHPTAKIAPNVQIGPNVVIDHSVEIGSNTQIKAQVFIGPGVKIGSHCDIHPQVVIREACELHNYVTLQSGSVIGSCGFGYSTDHNGQHKKLQQLGKVVLESHVEIGANTTIDRARFKETRICAGVKIDNLVQIAHNVHVGENSLVISQAGIAGSTKLGRYNVIAGQVGIVGHVELGDHVIIAARGAVTKNLKNPGHYGGAPALPGDQFYRQQMHFRKLDIYVNKIKSLEKKLEALETALENSLASTN